MIQLVQLAYFKPLFLKSLMAKARCVALCQIFCELSVWFQEAKKLS